MRRRGRELGIVGLIAFSATAVAGLDRLGSLPWLQVDWADLSGWLRITPTENAAAAALRLLALVLAYWLLGSSALYTLARLTRVPGVIRAAGWVSVPMVRHIVDRGIVVLLASSAVVAPPAGALAGEPKPPLVALSQDGTVLRPPGVEAPGYGTSVAGEGPKHEGAPTPATFPTPGPPPSNPSPPPQQGPGPGSPGVDVAEDLPALSSDAEAASPSTPPSASPSPHRWSHHTVVDGDNLWNIAAAHLATVTGRSQGALRIAEIHRHWLHVIAANRDSLRSSDPDLIYPGERITLPPLDLQEEGHD